MPSPRDVTGMKFNDLTAIKYLRNDGKYRIWLWKCRCGGTAEIHIGRVTTENTKSCGCRNMKHGMDGTKTHRAWRSMSERCSKRGHQYYHHYGGRGITVCERWRSFDAFLADMGVAPAGMTLDRIDNNGNYTPENCRWATMKEQGNNRRTNRTMTFHGDTLTLSQWADRTGLTYTSICQRVQLGWPIERVLTQPNQRKAPRALTIKEP